MSEYENVNKIRKLISLTEAENSDCVSNAHRGLEKLRELGLDGRIVFVNSENHAYLIPNSFPEDEIAINPPTRVEIDGHEDTFVQFDDYTIGELRDMVKNGEANDITHLHKHRDK